jgi:hypothetical protein
VKESTDEECKCGDIGIACWREVLEEGRGDKANAPSASSKGLVYGRGELANFSMEGEKGVELPLRCSSFSVNPAPSEVVLEVVR